MNRDVRAAIARIDVMADGGSLSRGTGCLVTERLVLTALHVVADRRAQPPQPYDGTIVLQFPGHHTEARLVDGLFDPHCDWALLECVEPPSCKPLPLGELTESGGEWETYGFPDAQPRDGMVQRGKVVNSEGDLDGTAAYQLYCVEAAAGRGAPVKGLSGSPVIVGGSVVGVLRFALMKEGLTVAGTLYACPASAAVEGADGRLPIPDPCFGLPGLPRQPLPEQPFRYLQHYTEADAEIFFGRNREIRELYGRVTDPDGSPIVLLHGQSGVGKSSFLDAGVVPRLRWHHRVCYVRRDPQRSLVESLRSCLVEAVHGAGEGAIDRGAALADLWRFVEDHHGQPFVLVLDQVEELFVQRGDPGELEELCRALVPLFAGDSPPRGRLVLGFRKEWFAEIEKQLSLAGLDASTMFLEGLDGKGIAEAVAGLASTRRLRERYHLSVEESLPAHVATDLLTDRDSPVAPQLQILLTRMWQAARSLDAESPSFSEKLYRDLGGGSRLLREFLDQQLEELEKRDRDAVRSGLALDVLIYHTTPGMTSRSRTGDEIAGAYRHLGDQVPRLIGDLKELFLLAERAGAGPEQSATTRVAHDTLAQQVRQRFDESDRPGQRARRILETHVQDWRRGRSDEALLDGTELAAVDDGRRGMRAPGSDEEKLVAVSHERWEKRARVERFTRRLLHALSVGVAIAAVGLLGLWLKVVVEKRQVELSNSTDIVTSQLLTEPVQALITAIAATGESTGHASSVAGPVRSGLGLARRVLPDAFGSFDRPGPALQVSLYRAMEEAREENLFGPFGGPVTSVAFESGGQSGGQVLAIGAGAPDEDWARDLPIKGHLAFWTVDGLIVGRPARDLPALARVHFLAGDDEVLTVATTGAVRRWARTGLSGDGASLETSVREGDEALAAVAVGDGGRLVLTGDEEGWLRAWRIPLGSVGRAPARLSGKVRAHAGRLFSLAISADGTLAASSGDDGHLHLWLPRAGELGEGPRLVGHEGEVLAVAISDDGASIASGGEDQTVRLWNPDGAARGEPFRRHNAAVSALVFSPDARRLVSGDRRGEVWLSDGQGKSVVPAPFRNPEPVTSLAMDSDGLIAVGDARGWVRLRDQHDAQIGRPLAFPEGGAVTAVAVHHSGSGPVVVAGGRGDHLHRWYATGPHPVGPLELPPVETEGVTTVAELIADRELGLLALRAGRVLRWPARELEPSTVTPRLPEVVAPESDGEALSRIALCPAAAAQTGEREQPPRRLVGLTRSGALMLYDLGTASAARRLADSETEARQLACSATGVVFLGADGTVERLGFDGQRSRLATESCSSSPITAIDVSADGSAIVAGDARGMVCGWRANGSTDRLLWPRRVHRYEVQQVRFSPDGQTVGTAGLQGRIALLEAASGESMAEPFEGHDDQVLGLGFGDGGRLLVSGSVAGEVRRWHTDWRSWLAISCDRLRHHPCFADPDTPLGSVCSSREDDRERRRTLARAQTTCAAWADVE